MDVLEQRLLQSKGKVVSMLQVSDECAFPTPHELVVAKDQFRGLKPRGPRVHASFLQCKQSAHHFIGICGRRKTETHIFLKFMRVSENWRWVHVFFNQPLSYLSPEIALAVYPIVIDPQRWREDTTVIQVFTHLMEPPIKIIGVVCQLRQMRGCFPLSFS